MNRFADYFSNYVNDDTITYIGNGDITSFTVSRQDRELAVGLNLESFVDYGIVENSQNQIARAMELKKVHINPRFPKSEFSLDNIERILEYVRHESPAANGFFDGCEAELEDRTLTLCLKKGGKDVLESQKVDRAIANKIYELFDLDFVVIFLEVQAFDIEKAVQKAVEERRAEEQHKKEEEEKNVNHELWDELPVFKDTLKKIYGKAIHEKPKNIADVSTEDGYITVWGDVLKTEVRETKRGTSKIFDFDISDYTSSITVKMFDDKRVIDPLVEKINEALLLFQAAISLIHFQINMFFALTQLRALKRLRKQMMSLKKELNSTCIPRYLRWMPFHLLQLLLSKLLNGGMRLWL